VTFLGNIYALSNPNSFTAQLGMPWGMRGSIGSFGVPLIVPAPAWMTAPDANVMLQQLQMFGAVPITTDDLLNFKSDFWTGGTPLSSLSPAQLSTLIWSYSPVAGKYVATPISSLFLTAKELHGMPQLTMAPNGWDPNVKTNFGPTGTGLGYSAARGYGTDAPGNVVNYVIGNPGINHGKYYGVTDTTLTVKDRVSSPFTAPTSTAQQKLVGTGLAGITIKGVTSAPGMYQIVSSGSSGPVISAGAGSPYQMCDAVWDTKDPSGRYVFREQIQARDSSITSKDALLAKVTSDHAFGEQLCAGQILKDFTYGYLVYAPNQSSSSSVSYNVVGVVPYKGLDWNALPGGAQRQRVDGTYWEPEWQIYARYKQTYGEAAANMIFQNPLAINDYSTLQGLNDGTGGEWLVDPSIYWGGKITSYQQFLNTPDSQLTNIFGTTNDLPGATGAGSHYTGSGNGAIYTKKPSITRFTVPSQMYVIGQDGRPHIVLETASSGGLGVGYTSFYNPATCIVDPVTGYVTQVPQKIGVDIAGMKSGGELALILHGDFANNPQLFSSKDESTLATIAAVFGSGQGETLNALMHWALGPNYQGSSLWQPRPGETTVDFNVRVLQTFMKDLRTEFNGIRSRYNTWRDSQPNKDNIRPFEFTPIAKSAEGLALGWNYDKFPSFGHVMMISYLYGDSEYIVPGVVKKDGHWEQTSATSDEGTYANAQRAYMFTYVKEVTDFLNRNPGKGGLLFGSEFEVKRFVNWATALKQYLLTPAQIEELRVSKQISDADAKLLTSLVGNYDGTLSDLKKQTSVVYDPETKKPITVFNAQVTGAVSGISTVGVSTIIGTGTGAVEVIYTVVRGGTTVLQTRWEMTGTAATGAGTSVQDPNTPRVELSGMTPPGFYQAAVEVKVQISQWVSSLPETGAIETPPSPTEGPYKDLGYEAKQAKLQEFMNSPTQVSADDWDVFFNNWGQMSVLLLNSVGRALSGSYFDRLIASGYSVEKVNAFYNVAGERMIQDGVNMHNIQMRLSSGRSYGSSTGVGTLAFLEFGEFAAGQLYISNLWLIGFAAVLLIWLRARPAGRRRR